MRRNKAICGACGWMLVLAGCQPAPPLPEARISWSRVELAPTIEDRPALPPPKAATLRQRASLPAQPETSVGLADARDRRQAVKDAVGAAQQRAREVLQQRLLDAYLAEIRRDQLTEARQIATARDERLRLFAGETRAIFERYARLRGPLLIRQKLIAEHPDRESLQTWLGNVDNRDREAERLRQEIQRLDLAYDQEIRRRVIEIEDQTNLDLAELTAEIETRRQEASQRAATEAAAQVEVQLKDLEGLERTVPPLKLERVEGTSAQMSMTVRRDPVPELSATITRDRRAEVRLEAEIWAAQVGYRLVEDPSAPDRTQEFTAWRKEKLGL